MAAESPQEWASVRVVPGAGEGTLARIGPVVLLVASTDPDVVRPYLDHVEMVAANGGQGRQLVRGLALMLSTAAEDSPGFAAIAPHTTGLAVFVDGPVTVTVGEESISGADSLAWVERLVPWPVGDVSATLPGASAPGASGFRLDGGVVPAASFTAVGGTAAPAAPAPPAMEEAMERGGMSTMDVPVDVESLPPPEPMPEPELMPEPEPEPATPGAPEGGAGGRPLPAPPADEQVDIKSVLLSDVEDDDDFEPLPTPGDESEIPRESHVHEEVRGVYCKNRHFNDPRQLFCAVCGINMVQQTPVLVSGLRPPLGVIVLDDGAVFQVDTPYLLGRDPDSDERVAAGRFRGLPVVDQSHQVSRVHARLELRGWDVVLIDNHSTNGTFVHVPKATDWQRLAPGGEHVLVQGTRVRIGNRTLAFNTHAGGA
ncbi:FHA domain-containing protein [Nocardioides sp. YIM 152588]|uniref:FHA domain-containing protein n=1 Tax=Nocardioides sp. YIM 152588 TaxID=3158259 RepID=UPI0032E384EC